MGGAVVTRNERAFEQPKLATAIREGVVALDGGRGRVFYASERYEEAHEFSIQVVHVIVTEGDARFEKFSL